MAIDNTPPRLKLIVTIAAITVITLIGISFATQSYYAYMSDEARHEKIAPTKDKDEQLKAEEAAFKSGLPIDQAMAQIAKGARPESITPAPSEDLGPMTGWSKMPKPAPVPHPHAEPAVADGGVDLAADGGGVDLATADGGVDLATDGGALVAAPEDAGAPSDAGAHGRDGGARRHRPLDGGNH
ncbi:MAG: hypothetical protein KIT84_30285 [Labilithrix sp.]|nr:hypothetical protein [Labilithrix sp.]MCW5815354.1 hypothetical protein [Labilithrix sp.]